MVVIGKLEEKSTFGEKKIYNHLEELNDKNKHYTFYFQPKIIDKYPDFIVIGKDIGALIIEVKDYTDEIKEITQSGPWISSRDDSTTLRNPYDQINSYLDEIDIALSKKKSLIDLNKFIQIGVVFSKIFFDSNLFTKIDKVTPVHFVNFFSNDIRSTHEKFKESFFIKFERKFSLSEVQLCNLNAVLIPNSEVPSTRQTRFGEFLDVDTDIKILDTIQEEKARNLGDGHRIICGVAGSGKTVLLMARARHLAIKHPTWKILILCYNKLLCDYIDRTIISNNLKNVKVFTYHSYARKKIKTIEELKKKLYKEEEKYNQEKSKDKLFSAIIPNLFIKSIGPDDQKFEAILIDVGDVLEFISELTEKLG